MTLNQTEKSHAVKLGRICSWRLEVHQYNQLLSHNKQVVRLVGVIKILISAASKLDKLHNPCLSNGLMCLNTCNLESATHHTVI